MMAPDITDLVTKLQQKIAILRGRSRRIFRSPRRGSVRR